MVAVTITLAGLDQLRAKCSPPLIYEESMKTALHQVGRAALAAAQRAAPKRTGRLRAGLSYRVNDKPAPRWVVVKSGAANRGYPYPRLLEFSSKHHHQNWLLNAIQGAKGQISSAARGALVEIERKWRA